MTFSMRARGSSSDRPSVRAIVFDVDGTLVDTLPAVQSALDEVLERTGRPAIDRALVRQHFSAGMDGLLRFALRVSGATVSSEESHALGQQLTQTYVNRLPDLARPFAGTQAMLLALTDHGHRLALCSNGNADALGCMLDAFGWRSHFAAVVDAGNATALKPSAAPLLQVLQALDMTPADAWMVGDSEFDAECAAAAGTVFLWAAWGYGDSNVGARSDWQLGRPGDLPPLAMR